MIVLDTHTWIWWVSDPSKLSKKAKDRIDLEMTSRSIYISSISTWEIAMLISKGRLELNKPLDQWLILCERLPFFSFVPVDNAIAVKSVHLPGTLHPDPADRLIISTSILMDATCITKDEKIRNYKYVSSLW